MKRRVCKERWRQNVGETNGGVCFYCKGSVLEEGIDKIFI